MKILKVLNRFQLVTTVLFCITVSMQAQTFEDATIFSSDGNAGDMFGRDVSISGSIAVIGSYHDTDNGTNSGSAYIFEQQIDGSWLQSAKLLASDGAADDLFGCSVSISGSTVVVGAYGNNDNGTRTGSAYIFESQVDGSWLQTAKLLASDSTALDQFGRAVSISNNYVLIGSLGDDDNGSSSGSAYIFEKQTDGSWIEAAKLLASDGATGDNFARSLNIFGSSAVIGAPFDNGQGSAYLFERQVTSNWIEVTKLIASDGATNDYFGFAVHHSDSVVVVGAHQDDDAGISSGSAYIFEQLIDGSWIQSTKLLPLDATAGDYFGHDVSISESTIVIGAYRNNSSGSDSGSAYVFTQNKDRSWSEQMKLLASDGSVNDWFGHSVCISDQRIVIGASHQDDPLSNQGCAYIFEIGCSSDLNTDGVVNILDILLLISDWGCTTSCIADTNNDNIVDIADLLQVIADFGDTC